jgi:hypothetical protein
MSSWWWGPPIAPIRTDYAKRHSGRRRELFDYRLERTESGLAPWPSAIPLEVLVGDVIEALRRIGPVTVSVLPDREENIEFRLPAELAAG